MRRTSIALLMLASLLLPSASFAQPTDQDRKDLYECQQKASEYAYNLGKGGDNKIFERHVQDCMDIRKAAAAKPQAKLGSARAADGACHPMSFINNSAETIYLGVWQGEASRGVEPPDGFADWKLAAGQTKKFCVPNGFNGRFVARTGCVNNQCETGNCCSPDTTNGNCDNNKCNTGNDPASLVEFTLDDKNAKDWYNTSFVDGFNFPIQVDLTLADGSQCAPAVGCSAVDACPTGDFVNGLCLAPYKKYELFHPDFMKEQLYYNLAAKCAFGGTKDKPVCGCGDQCANDKKPKDFCPDSQVVEGKTIYSAGCSPLALKNGDYKNDSRARDQVVCLDKDASAGCKFFWDEESTKYPVQIKAKCTGSYTWQYDDAGTLGNCPAADIKGFTVTFGSRPKGSFSTTMAVGPDPAMSGTVTVNGGTPLAFNGKLFNLIVKDKDNVVIADNCGRGNAILRTCAMTYDKNAGLAADTDADDCAKAFYCGYDWKNKTPKYLAMGKPSDDACTGSKGNFSLFPNNDTAGSWAVGTSSGSFPANGNPVKIAVSDKDSLTLVRACIGGGGKKLTCKFIYDKDSGLQNPGKDDPCTNSNIAWDTSKKTEFHFGLPGNIKACK